MIDEKDNTIIDEDDEIITMTYEDGTSENFYNLAELDYEGKWYMYLEPVNKPDDYNEDEVLVYEIAEDEESGEELLLPIEDDDLLNKLVEVLNEEIAKEE